jgi:hypothetical protein
MIRVLQLGLQLMESGHVGVALVIGQKVSELISNIIQE